MHSKLSPWHKVALLSVNAIVLGGISALGLTMMYWLIKFITWSDCK